MGQCVNLSNFEGLINCAQVVNDVVLRSKSTRFTKTHEGIKTRDILSRQEPN